MLIMTKTGENINTGSPKIPAKDRIQEYRRKLPQKYEEVEIPHTNDSRPETAAATS